MRANEENLVHLSNGRQSVGICNMKGRCRSVLTHVTIVTSDGFVEVQSDATQVEWHSLHCFFCGRELKKHVPAIM
jgi:hypothetical protein